MSRRIYTQAVPGTVSAAVLMPVYGSISWIKADELGLPKRIDRAHDTLKFTETEEEFVVRVNNARQKINDILVDKYGVEYPYIPVDYKISRRRMIKHDYYN